MKGWTAVSLSSLGLLAVLLCLTGRRAGAVSFEESYKICEGQSFTVAYTVRGNVVYRGTSYISPSYTIRGNEICHGRSYVNVAYTIRDGKIYKGRSYMDVAFTIRGDRVYYGDSFIDVAYTIRK